MRGLAAVPGIAVPALGRRGVLSGLVGAAAAVAAGCAPNALPSPGAAGEVYVALARARAIVVLDPTTDREVGRIPLDALGRAAHPWRLVVSPAGGAAVLPMPAMASVGLVSATGGGRGARVGTGRERAGRQCKLVRVDAGSPAPPLGALPETAQVLTADGMGRAYVLVADGAAGGPSYAAVVELETGAVARHLPLAAPGESVLALQASRDGERLYAAVWRWDDVPSGARAGTGRLVAVDTTRGRTLAQAALPQGTAVTDLALAAVPGGQILGLYAALATPGPSWDDDAIWDDALGRYELTALDPQRLTTLGLWALPRRPRATAVTPDGSRAYLLSGRWGTLAWSMRLTSLDLASGAVTATWSLPPGCQSLALSPAGKLYVADMLGDQLWRVDARRNVPLGSVPLPGVPVAVAARD